MGTRLSVRALPALLLILLVGAGAPVITPAATAQEGAPLATPIADIDSPNDTTTETAETTTDSPSAEPPLDPTAEPTTASPNPTVAATPLLPGNTPPTLTVTQGRDVAFGLLAFSGDEDGSASPTYVMTDAVTVEVSGGTGAWVVTCTVIGAAHGMELSWQLAGSSGNIWTPFADAPCYSAPDGGDRTLTFHYRLRVDPTAAPGPFAFEVIYEVSRL